MLFRFAFRQLIKSPGFTVVALLTLALGIGVSTTAFTTLNRLLFQALPFTQPDRLVQIWATEPSSPQVYVPAGDYFDLRQQSTSFEAIGAYFISNMGSIGQAGKAAERCTEIATTTEFLSAMGIQPMLGRTFTPAEQDHGDWLILLGHAYWVKHYNSDPSILGQMVRVDGRSVTVVGILPQQYDDPTLFGVPIDVWQLNHVGDNRDNRGFGWHQVAARLKPGVTFAQAQAELDTISARLAHQYPKTNAERRYHVIPYPTDSMDTTGSRLIWLVMGLSIAVLAIACVNLANLQLIRATGRSREIAIRLALGSSRLEVVGLLLTESLVLAIVGGALGLLVAQWGNLYIASYLKVDMPLELRVIAFTFMVSLVTGVLFGAGPAWLASHHDVNRGLKQSARGSTSDRSRHRFRHILIVMELALALTLLAGAAFFVNGIYRLTHRDLGWSADSAVVAMFSFSHENYGEAGDPRSAAFAEKFCNELLTVPGVQHAVISGSTPVFGPGGKVKYAIEGQPTGGRYEPVANFHNVMPDFFPTYGIHVLQGRNFADTDRLGNPPVVIVSQAFAQRCWPTENPVGKRIRSIDTEPAEWWEVVGVVGDIGYPNDMVLPERLPQIYRPFAQYSHRFFTITLSGTGNAPALKDSVQKTLARFEPDIALTYCFTIGEARASQVSGFAFVRRLLTFIAILGVLLAAIGIYAVIGNLASERTQEIGIRMALGAQARDVLWLFLRTGLWLSLIGVAVGLTCALGLTTILAKMLVTIPDSGPLVVIAISVFLVIIAVTACWIPARRATRVDPIIALRAE